MTTFTSDIRIIKLQAIITSSGHFIARLSLCCLKTSGQAGRGLDHLLGLTHEATGAVWSACWEAPTTGQAAEVCCPFSARLSGPSARCRQRRHSGSSHLGPQSGRTPGAWRAWEHCFPGQTAGCVGMKRVSGSPCASLGT